MQTDLRVQLRVETHTPHTCDELIAAVRRFGVDYVIFNDHLGEALQQYETDPAGHAAYCNGFGCAPEIYAGRLVAARRAAAAVPRYLCTLAASFDALGVIYGSHDDPDAETRETYAMIGARICEFPLSRNVARLARAKGDPVLMGAPNVVRGGSQNGNVSATALIAAGECDALVSDYHYPALAAAAFHLSDEGVLPLARAWALISSRPAQIMRLADRGLITEGRRADLAIINEETRAIEATFVAGRLTHLTGEAASRILSTRAGLAMAAE
jgi:alpha-D-ribose 1-methylphosphonate 5-triphosphate diphosphatase